MRPGRSFPLRFVGVFVAFVLAFFLAFANSSMSAPRAMAATAVTPKGPTYNDTAKTVYIPADSGVRYHIYVVSNGNQEIIWPESGFDYARPGTYTNAQGIDASKLILITAQSAGSATTLEGRTTWAHIFPGPASPTYDDLTSAVTIPTVEGAEFTVNGTTAAPGTIAVAGGSTATITAVSDTDPAKGAPAGSWTHAFPQVVTPKGPTFNDQTPAIVIPADAGVRYYIDVAGTNVTEENLPYAKPGTYTAADGIAQEKLITVTAMTAGSSVVLTGTQ